MGNIDNFCMALVCNECITCYLKKFNFIFSCSDEEIDVYDDDAAASVAPPVPPAPLVLPAFAGGPPAPLVPSATVHVPPAPLVLPAFASGPPAPVVPSATVHVPPAPLVLSAFVPVPPAPVVAPAPVSLAPVPVPPAPVVAPVGPPAPVVAPVVAPAPVPVPPAPAAHGGRRGRGAAGLGGDVRGRGGAARGCGGAARYGICSWILAYQSWRLRLCYWAGQSTGNQNCGTFPLSNLGKIYKSGFKFIQG